jgi:hypothetical protein
MQDQFKNPYSFRGEIYFDKGWGKKENLRTHTDSSRKLSFADLVNTFESKINSSIVKNIKIYISFINTYKERKGSNC